MKRIYNRILLVLILNLLPFGAWADEEPAVNKEALWQSAVQAYMNADYAQAERDFIQLENAGYISADLMYNLGNVYFKMDGQLARSILYYERALRLDPSYADAKVNLDMAREFSQDRIDEVPEFILITWIKSIRNSMSTNSWAYLSILFFVLVAVFLLVFRYAPAAWMRKTGFVVAVLSLALSLSAFGFSLALNAHISNEHEAVISSSVVSVHSSPNKTSTSLFNLHEGTKVEIVEELGSWTKVEISDGRQGWMESQNFLII